MMHILKPLVVAAEILALTVPPVMAQVAPPPGPAAPGGSGAADLPAPKSPLPPQEKVVDGPVQKVDPAAKTVQVGWFLGLMSTTLEVTEDTRIAVGGTKASLSEIREGDRVQAAYEARDGKNIAKAIEVTGDAARTNGKAWPLERGPGIPPPAPMK